MKLDAVLASSEALRVALASPLVAQAIANSALGVALANPDAAFALSQEVAVNAVLAAATRQSQCDGCLVAGHGRRCHKCCRKRCPLTITIYRPTLTSIKPEARSNASRFRPAFAGASPGLP